MCSESAELYLHKSSIEEEKRAFKTLIELKPRLVIDRRDIELENQTRAIRADVNTRKGGVDSEIELDIMSDRALWQQ